MKKNKIFLAGSSGYLGKILHDRLKSDFFLICSHRKKKKIIDLKNKKKLKELIKNKKIEIVLNLVGGQNELSKKKLIIENSNLINICNKYNIKVIFFSSSSIYGSSKILSTENNPPKPFDSYTLNKIKLENLYKKKSNDYKILRLSNVYDDKLSKSGIFKNIKEHLLFNKKISFNNLKVIRNYIHSKDVANQIKQIIIKYDRINHKIINISNENLSILSILKLFEKKYKQKIKYTINKQKKYDPSIKVGNGLARKILKYKNRFSLANTIIYSKRS